MRRSIFFLWWALALLAFSCGFATTGHWYWAPGVLGCASAWLFAWRRRANLCLVASTLLAALGILLAAPALPMILGASAALGLWDFAAAPLGASRAALAYYHRSVLPLTLIALAIGTSAAALGLGTRLRLPFVVMLLCVLACAFSFDRVVRLLRRKK